MKESVNLQEVVSVKDKPGLYLLKSYNPNGYHIQPLVGGQVTTISNEKGRVLALGNVDLKLMEGSINLLEVFRKLNESKAHESKEVEIRQIFKKIIPNLNDQAVADSHLQKVLKWYLLLQDHVQADQVVNEEDEGLTIV